MRIESFAEFRVCPDDCRYMAELLSYHCEFQCVKPEDCGAGRTNPHAFIPDEQQHICRRCNVVGCLTCSLTQKDACLPDGCASLYHFDSKTGSCHMVGWPFYMALKVFVLVLVVYLGIWYLDILLLRPAVNNHGLEEGLRCRESSKIHMPLQDGREGLEQYPLFTNMLRADNAGVAGPGAVLHFNFQLTVILWSLIIAGAWYALAKATEPDLLRLGLRAAVTPARQCAVIHWGNRIENATRWLKVNFLLGAYLGSFLGSIVYSIIQKKRFSQMDNITTMKDFAAVVRGLPKHTGDNLSVESEVKAFLEEKTGQRVLGVSVAWNYMDKRDEVSELLHEEMSELEERYEQRKSVRPGSVHAPSSADGGSGGTPGDDGLSRQSPNCLRRVLMLVDEFILHAPNCCSESQSTDEDEKDEDKLCAHKLLNGLETSGMAFAVFNTEHERDLAVEACADEGGFERPDAPGQFTTLQVEMVEPDTVAFHFLGITNFQFAKNVIWGLMVVELAQVIWIACFYAPYAYYIAAFAFANGDSPDWYLCISFSVLVAIGNQAMYQVCTVVSASTGFEFTDKCECYYIALYSAACFLNTVLDLVLTGYLSYRQMIAMGRHFIDGRLMAYSHSFHAIYEDWSMQRLLGAQMWSTTYPGAFVLPYIVELVMCTLVIRHLQTLIVKSRRDLSLEMSQEAMQVYFTMDMGRYSDLVLNSLLAVLSLFFAPGFFAKTFFTMACGFIFVIFYDTYRALRCVPAFYYSTDTIDRMAQAAWGVPCGLILVAYVVKTNCVGGYHSAEDGTFCVRDGMLLRRMVLAFAVHMVLYLFIHRVCLSFVSRCFRHTPSEEDFAAVSARMPASWFTANPVHCLRSKILHRHDPPCVFRMAGREHLMRANPDICCHFQKERG